MDQLSSCRLGNCRFWVGRVERTDIRNKAWPLASLSVRRGAASLRPVVASFLGSISTNYGSYHCQFYILPSLATDPTLSSQSLPSPLELHCIVQGDDTDHVFPVTIATTESVGALKKAIKEENKHAFEQVDAKILNLWKASAPFSAYAGRC